eukprot:11689526-Karenia_brevis.AAC.1
MPDKEFHVQWEDAVIEIGGQESFQVEEPKKECPPHVVWKQSVIACNKVPKDAIVNAFNSAVSKRSRNPTTEMWQG